jgi:hypothetical protein
MRRLCSQNSEKIKSPYIRITQSDTKEVVLIITLTKLATTVV